MEQRPGHEPRIFRPGSGGLHDLAAARGNGYHQASAQLVGIGLGPLRNRAALHRYLGRGIVFGAHGICDYGFRCGAPVERDLVLRKLFFPLLVLFFMVPIPAVLYNRVTPHSPKNCLPGNGWQPVETGLISISAPGRADPIVANRYVASHGDEKAVVIYWYQSHRRIVASEYAAKFWLVADSIRYHRSDTALVKVVVPVVEEHTDSATSIGVNFVRAFFPELARRLPA
jgi:Protein of unknown function (DUF3485)